MDINLKRTFCCQQKFRNCNHKHLDNEKYTKKLYLKPFPNENETHKKMPTI